MPHRRITTNPFLLDFLNKVFDTNEEFAADHEESFFDSFRNDQNPYMTILKCSDSRVQMESFDKTPQNGVFAIRNIGNQIVTSEGSIDFGIRILQTPILLIIGHSGCGAVDAALHKHNIESDTINKELRTLKVTKNNLTDAIIENVNKQVSKAVEKYRDLLLEEKLTIIGAVYDFKNDLGFGKGKIVFLNINDVSDFQEVQQHFGGRVRNLHFYQADKQ